MKVLALAGEQYELHPLRAAGLCECVRLARACLRIIETSDGSGALEQALAENGALAAVCLYKKGRRAFFSAFDALRALTVDELCAVYDACADDAQAASESEESGAYGIPKSFQKNEGDIP